MTRTELLERLADPELATDAARALAPQAGLLSGDDLGRVLTEAASPAVGTVAFAIPGLGPADLLVALDWPLLLNTPADARIALADQPALTAGFLKATVAERSRPRALRIAYGPYHRPDVLEAAPPGDVPWDPPSWAMSAGQRAVHVGDLPTPLLVRALPDMAPYLTSRLLRDPERRYIRDKAVSDWVLTEGSPQNLRELAVHGRPAVLCDAMAALLERDPLLAVSTVLNAELDVRALPAALQGALMRHAAATSADVRQAVFAALGRPPASHAR